MARMMQKLSIFICLLAVYMLDVSLALESSMPDHARVHKFSMDAVSEEFESRTMNERSTRHKRAVDSKCQRQETDFLAAVKEEDIIDKHQFVNETNYSLALSWAGREDTDDGKDNGVILVAATQEMLGLAAQSSLYRSGNSGKSFDNITSQLHGAYIRKDNGLQKHLHRAQTVFVICHNNDPEHGLMYRTTDGGKTFDKILLDFIFNGEFVFHPNTEHADRILVKSTKDELYVTEDNGNQWKKIRNDVQNFKWSTIPSESRAIFAVYDKSSIFGLDNELVKSSDLGNTWQPIKDDIYTFGMQGKFLYVSVMKPNDERVMEVSTDGGKSWAEVQLPSITEDRFYSILDMSEQIIFMHVDNPGDSGHGILYTSDATGIIFAESLTNHLYPNYLELTDFYKVQSVRGTYLASQLSDADQSIHTVISLDRGAEWNHVGRPDGGDCKEGSKECHLQVHYMYSQSRGVNANAPLSVEGAPGIILVHGHIADALQTTDPDVYVTSDGGYTWSLALNGPHHYQIADQGGLLVAVPADTHTPKVVKFSTDEGRCWHEYTFTDENVIMTGLLTEPGNKAMSVAIFGYGETDREWRTFVVDFEKAVPRHCEELDYEEWTPHVKSEKLSGCLLGSKETFDRLKKDSWCSNGRAIMEKKTEKCECTKLDYECDYGYSRGVGSEDCSKEKEFKGPDIDICLRGHEEELITTGYRKIPGDVCEGGFKPKSDSFIDLKKLCAEGDKEVIEEDLGIEDYDAQLADKREKSTRTSVVLVITLIGTSLIVLVVLGFIVKKYRLMKKVPRIRYGALRTEPDLEHLIDENLGNNTSLYEDDSDDDAAAASKGGGGVFLYGNKQAPAPLSTTARSPPQGSYGGTSSWSAAPGAMRSPPGGSVKSPPPPPMNGSAAAPKSKLPKVKSYHDDSDEDMLE